MKGFKMMVILAVVLCLGAAAASGIAYGQTFMVDQTGTVAFSYDLDCQENSLNAMPATATYADEAASGQSIIFKDGVPTTVIGTDGTPAPYSASMWDFLAGYIETGPYGVGVSSNPDVPTGGTYLMTETPESGTFGTQEPNMSLG